MKTRSIFSIITLSLIFAVIFSSCRKDPEISDPGPDPIQVSLDIAVAASLENTSLQSGKNIPTVSALIDSPKGYYFASAANDNYSPITADTYFRFASNTKNFTSAAILKMQELGWLNIHDKITDIIPAMVDTYVPDIPEWNIPFKDQITIRLLMQHAAGVYDVDNDSVPGFGGKSYTQAVQDMDPDHQFNVTEMVNQIMINKLVYFEPGMGYHYSNTGYAILGEIAGRVYSLHSGSQKHLTDFLHDFLYGPGTKVPLDIHFPYLATEQDMSSPYCCGYELFSPTDFDEYCSYNMSAQVAEGNGYTTMNNLRTYIRTLMRGENFLSVNSVEMMKSDVSTANPNYGLGCSHVPGLGYGHNGARIGNVSTMMYDPVNDVTVVVYINAFDGDDVTITLQAMIDMAYAAREAAGYSGKP